MHNPGEQTTAHSFCTLNGFLQTWAWKDMEGGGYRWLHESYLTTPHNTSFYSRRTTCI